MPKVSVIMTSFNRAELLPRAIESVLSQDMTDFELIIVDDGSQDNSPKVITDYAERDERIHAVLNAHNRGANACRNQGIELASGEFITGLDDDDYFLPERLSILLAAYNDAYSFVCDNVKIKQADSFRLAYKNGPLLITKGKILKTNHAGNQVFTRTQRLRDIGGFDITLRRQQDYDAWTRLILKFGPAQRIDVGTYVMDMSHGGVRISTREKKIDSLTKYYSKYGEFMSPRLKLYHRIRLYFMNAAVPGFSPAECLLMPIWSWKQFKSNRYE